MLAISNCRQYLVIIAGLLLLSLNWEIVFTRFGIGILGFWQTVIITLILTTFLFFISLWITTPRRSWPSLLRLGKSKSLQNTIKSSALSQLWIASSEELVWRVCLQAIFINLFGLPIGIVATALLFWGAHLKNVELLSRTSLDIIVFSIVLGFTFEVTSSFPLIVALHTLKNILAKTYRYSLANQKTQ